MKQFLKSFLTVSLLLTPAIQADGCGSNSCSTTNSCNSCESNSCNESCSSTSNCNSCGSNSCNGGCNSNTTCGSTCNLASTFVPRSPGADTTRELVGWQDWIHRGPEAGAYKTYAFAFQYERSFHGNKIAQNLFGTSTLNFVGSQVANRVNTGTAGCCNLLADYFGLPTNTNASLKLKPLIENFIFDFEYFRGFDVCGWDGFYFRAHLPLVYARWTLFENDANGCCLNTTAGVGTNVAYPDGYMSVNNFTANYPANTAYPFTSLQAALSGKQFGNMVDPWHFGKFSFCKLSKFGVADLDLILGWDFWNEDCGHFGLYIQGVVPTANRRTGEFIFEPMVGDRHGKLGGGVSTHYDLWECNDHKLAVWLEGNVVHWFNSYENRSFDFNVTNTAGSTVCSPLSRYMLLKEFDANNVSTGGFINAINFTTRKTRINLAVEGDATLKFAYKYCNWTFDVGYNVYGKSAEKGCITCSPCDYSVDGRNFGFKGTEGLYGLEYTYTTVTSSGAYNLIAPVQTTISANVPLSVNLNSTQSFATMCSPTVETAVDNAVTTLGATTIIAGEPTGDVLLTWNSSAVTTVGSNGFTLINGATNVNGIIVAQQSVAPVTFNTTATNLNLASGLAASQLTNKVFGYINHAWKDCKNTPFLGIGATGEWATKINCKTAGLSQWSVIVKAGMAF